MPSIRLVTDRATPNRYKRLEEYSGLRGWVEQLIQKAKKNKKAINGSDGASGGGKKGIIIPKLSKSEAFFFFFPPLADVV